VEPFPYEFGVRVNKFQILHGDDSVEINLRYGLIREIGRKNIRLMKHGFRWLSLLKEIVAGLVDDIKFNIIPRPCVNKVCMMFVL
jgi:hypothetical protein